MRLITHAHHSWSEVDASAWDALVADASPFLEHAFLHGLEVTGCASPETGWHPRPVTVWRGDTLVAGAPLWWVDHDHGQFVWQGHWERAAKDAGLSLTPKAVLGVPFTPVTGARTLAVDEAAERALLSGIQQAIQSTKALHVFFPTAEELPRWRASRLFVRKQYQFHWKNRGYSSYDDFLQAFRSKRRKEMRRERREVAHLRLDRVHSPDTTLIGQLWDAYEGTVERHGGTDRFLNRSFFEHLHAHWAHRLVGVRARDGERFVAGALCVQKGERLYGRYWGLTEPIPFLHFEVCYHQGIEHCIANGLSAFEPGHGGDHKFRRGFEPEYTWSAHAFVHPGAQLSFKRSAKREAEWFDERVQELRDRSPLKPRSPE